MHLHCKYMRHAPLVWYPQRYQFADIGKYFLRSSITFFTIPLACKKFLARQALSNNKLLKVPLIQNVKQKLFL